jgi:hypothetical protein
VKGPFVLADRKGEAGRDAQGEKHSDAVVAYSAAAFAEPVTKADLAGKKICWSDGYAAYDKNGRRRAADLLAIRCASAI